MAIVIVEGESDRIAIEVIADRLDLPVPNIVPIGGAHAAANVAAGLGESSPGERIIGLVDIGERLVFDVVVDDVFVCDRDLEDELIRALGIAAALTVIEQQGELGSFHKLQKQPAQRGRDTLDQIRQFLHGRSGNKAKYAALFAAALNLDKVPEPLCGVLAAANSDGDER